MGFLEFIFSPYKNPLPALMYYRTLYVSDFVRRFFVRCANNMDHNILEFECAGLNDGGKFPIENTGRGKDISPEFIIKNLSQKAVTMIITLEDLSHPIKEFTQWII